MSMASTFQTAKDYVTTLGKIEFDDIPVGETPFVSSNDVYTLKKANDDVKFAIRLLCGIKQTQTYESLDEQKKAMVDMYHAGKDDRIYQFIQRVSNKEVNNSNIVQYNNSHEHLPTVYVLYKLTPRLYQYLTYIIDSDFKKDSHIKSAYEKVSTSTRTPISDSKFRNYYVTARYLFEELRDNDDEQTVIATVKRRAMKTFNKSDENEETKIIRERAYEQRIQDPQYITDLLTTIEISNRKFLIDFDVQDFGGDGDCLFRTLLAYLKVHHLDALRRICNEIGLRFTPKLKFSGDFNDMSTDARLLRVAIVDYVRNNPKNDIYPTRPNLTDSVQRGTFMNYINANYSNGNTNDPLMNYWNIMTKGEWGTDLEISAASRLFKINICVVNSRGLGLDQVFYIDQASNNFCFIFNSNISHYMNLWRVYPIREGPRPLGTRSASESDEASRAINSSATATPSPPFAAAAAAAAAAAGIAASHPPPPPPLNTTDVAIDQIRKRIGEISTAGMAAGSSSLRAPPARNIAILVNGGSFNPIHNGHLEMYTLARTELMKTHGFHDVLVIYVVSPYAELEDKITRLHEPTRAAEGGSHNPKIIPHGMTKEDSIAQNIFDAPDKLDRIKICREALASIDNVSNGNKMTVDGQHLSQNMFVWPNEDRNAFSIHKQITGLTNVRFYGLSGSDYSNQGYFLYGIDGYSIIVGRSNTRPPNFTNYLYNGVVTNTSKTGIFINTASEIASSNIRPAIFELRDFLKGINAETDNQTIIQMVTNLTNPYITGNRGGQTGVNLLRDVPNSILFRLLTYGEDPSVQMRRGEYGTAKEGYRRFRARLFQQKLSKFGSTTSTIQQTLHDVTDMRSSYDQKQIDEIIAKNRPIDDHNIHFLQMTSAHALYTQGKGSTTSLLNFANADTVGGGVLNGSTVQEETLCMMAPELYRSLDVATNPKGSHLYNNWGHNNWNSKFYYSSDQLIPFTTTDEFTFDTNKQPFNLHTPYMGHVISAAAFEWGKFNKYTNNFGQTFDPLTITKTDFNKKMIDIIKNIIAVAAFIQKCDVLILGAWGCGAFAPKANRNEYIKYVATLFCQALYSTVDGDIKLKDLFKKVIFPIPDCNTYDLFKQGFDEEEARILHPLPAPAHTPSLSPAAASSPAAPAAPASSTAAPEPTPPYVTLTNITTRMDTSINNFVEQLSQRNPLKEISVNETEGKSSAASAAASAASKFTRVDGDFPKLTVPLFEQMVYHRAGSLNLKPLAMFIPTGYKINFQEINEYFKEMARRNDPETQELVNLVIAAYGNNNNSLFYRHTLPGKVTAVGGPRPVMVGGALSFPTTMTTMTTTTTTTTKGVFDLDEKTAKLIQFKIDKWHRSYIDWCFYRNATRFFVENQQLPKDELVTLKMEFDEVFDAKSGGKGLMSMVVNINKDYENIKKHYETNVKKNVGQNSNDFQSFIYLFDILYAEIQKYKDDSLDYVTERKKYFPSYSFDVNSRSLLLQVVDKFRSIFLQLKLLEDTPHPRESNNFIDTVPYLSQLETLQSIADEFMRLKQSIEANPALKTAVEIFEKYMLTSNGFLDVNRQTKHIPSYKIIQYVFQTIGYYNDEPRTTPPAPAPAGLFEGYVGKLYTVGSATKPKDPKEIFVKPIDDEFIEKLFNETNIDSHPYHNEMVKLNEIIREHMTLIEKLKERKDYNDPDYVSSLFASAEATTTRSKKQRTVFGAGIADSGTLTKKIKALNRDLQAFSTTADADADEVYTNNESLDNKIKQVESKIKLLKGKYFVSSLLFYNHYFITTPSASPSPGPAPKDITTAAANFFQKFYTESKLSTPEVESFPQKNAVPFSIGIDLIFLLLFRISKYYFSSFHATFVEKLKEQIGPQNVGLRALRENVQYKESKLNHVCEIVAKLLGISVVRIIPDRSSYLIKADNNVFKGFVSVDTPSGYSKKWEENIDNPAGNYSAKIKYVTNEMTKGLDKALGFIDPATAIKNGSSADVENRKKMKSALVVLLEHNTVQVVHMLFAKPRDIWYSPDMPTGTLTSVSKWAFFRLEKPEIIAKSTFKLLNSKWDESVVSTSSPPRLEYILDKTATASPDDFKIKIVDDSVFKSNSLPSSDNPLCVFLIATQPSPQMLAPGKDSANESRFQNSSFSVGGIEPSINDNHAVGSKLFQKLKEAIRPDPEKCSNVRGLIQEQASELASMTTDLLKAAGVDTSIKIAGLKNQIAMAALNRAMKLIVVQVNPGPTYDISKSPPQPNVDEALSIANRYKNDPDFDAIRGFCLFINKRREEITQKPPPTDSETDKYAGIDLILDSLKKKRSSPSIKTIVVLVLLIIKDGSKYIDKISSGAQTGGGRRQIYVGGANTSISNDLVVKLLREAAETPYVVAKFVLARTNFYNPTIKFGMDDAAVLTMIKGVADQGYASAEYLYANMLENQTQQSEETKRAPEYYKRAAARGHIDAVYNSLTLHKSDDDKKALPENDSDKYLKFVSVDPTKTPIEYDYTEKHITDAKTILNDRSIKIEAEKNRLKAEENAKRKVTEEANRAKKPKSTTQKGDDGLIEAAKLEAESLLDNDLDDDDSGSEEGTVVDVDAGYVSASLVGATAAATAAAIAAASSFSDSDEDDEEEEDEYDEDGRPKSRLPSAKPPSPTTEESQQSRPLTREQRQQQQQLQLRLAAAAATAAAATATVPPRPYLSPPTSAPTSAAATAALPLLSPDELKSAQPISADDLQILRAQLTRLQQQAVQPQFTSPAPPASQAASPAPASLAPQSAPPAASPAPASLAPQSAPPAASPAPPASPAPASLAPQSDVVPPTPLQILLAERRDQQVRRLQLSNLQPKSESSHPLPSAGVSGFAAALGNEGIRPGDVNIAFAGKGPEIMLNGDILVHNPQQSGQIGGSKINQVGGLTYKLLPGTELYKTVATTHGGLNPEFYKELSKEIEKGNNKVELVPATKSNDAKSHDDNLSPAEQSANNPEVIKNLIRSLDPKIVPDNAKTVERYEQLVKMCDKTTAVELIKQLLLSKSIPIEKLTDERILEILGWNKNTNELLYRHNGQGLFSFFCFDDKRNFSPAFIHHCEKNYVCMLNWVLILAFRLRIREPIKYTDAAIKELIKNMHKALYGFVTPVSMAKNFTRLDADPKFYTDMSKKNMNTDIFNDVTLTPLVTGIKAQVPQIPDTKNASLSSYFPKKITIDPRIKKTTVKLGRGGSLRANSKNSTRKLHRHGRVRPTSHTIKITHKSNSNTKKTVSKRNNQFALRM
jgi:uncharacterized protein (TIGR02452 family)